MRWLRFTSPEDNSCFVPAPRVPLSRACARRTPRPTQACTEWPPGGKAMATAEHLALDELVAPMHFSPQLEAAIQEVRTSGRSLQHIGLQP